MVKSQESSTNLKIMTQKFESFQQTKSGSSQKISWADDGKLKQLEIESRYQDQIKQLKSTILELQNQNYQNQLHQQAQVEELEQYKQKCLIVEMLNKSNSKLCRSSEKEQKKNENNIGQLEKKLKESDKLINLLQSQNKRLQEQLELETQDLNNNLYEEFQQLKLENQYYQQQVSEEFQLECNKYISQIEEQSAIINNYQLRLTKEHELNDGLESELQELRKQLNIQEKIIQQQQNQLNILMETKEDHSQSTKLFTLQPQKYTTSNSNYDRQHSNKENLNLFSGKNINCDTLFEFTTGNKSKKSRNEDSYKPTLFRTESFSSINSTQSGLKQDFQQTHLQLDNLSKLQNSSFSKDQSTPNNQRQQPMSSHSKKLGTWFQNEFKK